MIVKIQLPVASSSHDLRVNVNKGGEKKALIYSKDKSLLFETDVGSVKKYFGKNERLIYAELALGDADLATQPSTFAVTKRLFNQDW